MTPSARRLASLAGSHSSYAEADGLLRELSGLHFGAKRVERTTRAAGDDLEAWRADAPAAWAARIAEVNKQRRLRTNTASTFTQSTAARQA